MVGGAGERPVKAPSPALCVRVPIAPRWGEPSPDSPPSAQHKKSAPRPPRCAEDCPCALSVSTSTMWLGQDHRGRVCGGATEQSCMSRILSKALRRVKSFLRVADARKSIYRLSHI